MEMLAATLGRVQELFSDDYSPKSANMMNVIFHYLPCYQVVLCNIYGFIMNHSPYMVSGKNLHIHDISDLSMLTSITAQSVKWMLLN